MVVAHLAERLLLIPEVYSSNPVIGKILYIEHLLKEFKTFHEKRFFRLSLTTKFVFLNIKPTKFKILECTFYNKQASQDA